MRIQNVRNGLAMVAAMVLGASLIVLAAEGKKEGYTDTPYLPGGKWRVHDAERPHPKIITPGTCSTQDKAGAVPSDATVLFDGKDISAWTANDKGKEIAAPWKVEDGYMEGAKTSISTKEKFGDIQLHVEFCEPTPPKGNSQGRGNSGVLIMGRYEIQVLDNYDNLTYADGQCGAMYGLNPPLVNACRKPGQWQSYDIVFEAPVFEGNKVVKPAYVTVLLNGVLLHNHQAFLGTSLYRQVGRYSPHAPKEPLQLQFHGNPVRYRNVWVRPIRTYDEVTEEGAQKPAAEAAKETK